MPGDQTEVALRLLDGDAGLQAAEGLQRMVVTRELKLVRNERHPEPLIFRELELFRHHADDFGGLRVEQEFPPDDRRIALIPVHPDVVAEHHDVRGARRVVALGERPAENRLLSEHLEQVPRDIGSAEALRLARAIRDREAAAADAGHRRKRGLPGSPILERRIGQRVLRDVGFGVLRVQRHEVIRIEIRQRLNDDPVGDAEDRRIEADAESQAPDGHEREPLVKPESANGVAQLSEYRHVALDVALSLRVQAC